MQSQYLTRREAAQYLTDRGLRIAWTTLQKLAHVGGGPLYRQFGTRTIYTPEDLDSWAAAKMSAPRRSTSEAA